MLSVGIVAGAFKMDKVKNVHMVLSSLATNPYFIDVSVSSNRIAQGDTLLVVVHNEPNEVSGMLGEVPLHFSRTENGTDWIALVGIAVTKKLGPYTLELTAPGKSSLKQKISVFKRNFRVTPLAYTPELQQKGFSAQELSNNIAEGEGKQLRALLNNITPTAYFSRPFINPLLIPFIITGAFGDIRQNGAVKVQHLGVDLGSPIGTSVIAANTGKVVFEGNFPDYGNTLVIDHGLGIYSLYLHLSEFKVSEGQIVPQASIIALSGNTGYAIGPHLHFSIKIRGVAVDPLKFIYATQALPW